MAEGLHILVVSQFFSPEMAAPAARFHDLGRLLLERGHRMTVVTGFPNFPSGEIHAGYRGRVWQREVIDGIEILRGWIYASPRQTPLRKSLSFASFVASSSLRILFGRLRPDVVVATSPPPSAFISGMLAARRLRIPLVLDIRDIWPEQLVAAGRLRSPSLARFLESLATAAYRASSAITVVTEGKRAPLMEKGVPEEKLFVLPNGVDFSRFDEEVPVASMLRGYGVDASRFLVTYAGIFGAAQGLDVLLDAASALRAKQPQQARRVQFVLVGSGVERERIGRRVESENLGELVVLVPEQPRAHIPSLLRAAGAVAVTLRPRRDTHTVPSKIYEAFASARPLLVSADGAPAEMLRESGAGIDTPAGDADALADAILSLLEGPDLTARLGEKGRSYVKRFDRRLLVDGLEQILRDVVARARR
jgi:glycosyltransferase involved in cell wall biosynthesis